MNRAGPKSQGTSNPQPPDTQKLKLDRVDSAVTKLCDLHVYKVPPELWRDNLNNILNSDVSDTVSVGIIRVPCELRLSDVREEIVQQLGGSTFDIIPEEFVILRSVGRSLTTLRSKQEQLLKAKHFLPPVAYAPELYILEATTEIREALANTESSLQQSPPLSQRTSISQTGYPMTYRDGYNDNRKAHNKNDLVSPEDVHGRQLNQHYVKQGKQNRFKAGISDDESVDQRNKAHLHHQDPRLLGKQNWQSNQANKDRWIAEQEQKNNKLRDGHMGQINKDVHERNVQESNMSKRAAVSRVSQGERRQVGELNKNMKDRGGRQPVSQRTNPDGRTHVLKQSYFTHLNSRKDGTDGSTSPTDDDRMGHDSLNIHQQQRNTKNQLLKSIESTKQTKRDLEKEREELLRKAKQLQQKTIKFRNESRDMWKKRYFDEKKKTAPLEDISNRLQSELEVLQRSQLTWLEGSRDRAFRSMDVGPSEKNNYVIQCIRLQHEIEDLKRRVEMARMKLSTEMKLRVQAQSDMKAVRSEAMQNRLSIKMSRQQQFGSTRALNTVK